MNYSEGIEYMLSLSDGSGNFSPYEGITINYPGYKRKGDYRLTVTGGKAPTHSAISRELYDLINNNSYSFEELKDFLSDIYSNGTNTLYSDSKLEHLKHFIYWVTLQEEINYPRANGKAGINLAFCRFFEAIYSTQPGSDFSINEVQIRCNNHGQAKPVLYRINHAPDFYHY